MQRGTHVQLRIDINNDGSWDITKNSNRDLPALRRDIKYTANWTRVWQMAEGIHAYEICVNTDRRFVEKNYDNNCALGTFSASASAPTANSRSTAAQPFTLNLARGANGLEVSRMQIFLQNEGYLDEDASLGLFEQTTEEAIKLFQEDQKLRLTGRWDAPTRSRADDLGVERPPQSLNTEQEQLAMTLQATRSKLTRIQALLKLLRQ